MNIVAQDYKLCLTGGNALQIKKRSKQVCCDVEEFTALVSGTRYLLEIEQKQVIKEYILVNVGTGTSFFHITQNGFERLLGSGIGGGTLLGLGSLQTGEHSFRSLIELAKHGDSTRSDLLVKDIYQHGASPVIGDLTAANFGKAYLQQATSADLVASLVTMMGENLLLLASQAAMLKNCQHIVFIGSTLNGNTPLKNILTGFKGMLPFDIIFLEKGSHAGAVGAWLD